MGQTDVAIEIMYTFLTGGTMRLLARPLFVLTTILLALAPAAALADVVSPPPDKCPEGHTPQTGHHGPYCQPPPPESCPTGHTPKVHRDHAYCEPPADPPCPPGSYHTSTSAKNTWCQAGWKAPEGGECGTGYKPIESGLCVRYVPAGRMGYEVVSGTCETDGDCSGKLESCAVTTRCVPVPRPAPPATVPAPSATEAEVAQEPAVESDEEEDDPAKGRCAVGSVDAEPRSAAVGGVVALVAILLARRRR